VRLEPILLQLVVLLAGSVLAQVQVLNVFDACQSHFTVSDELVVGRPKVNVLLQLMVEFTLIAVGGARQVLWKCFPSMLPPLAFKLKKIMQMFFSMTLYNFNNIPMFLLHFTNA
jgi:hypothetical protein